MSWWRRRWWWWIISCHNLNRFNTSLVQAHSDEAVEYTNCITLRRGESPTPILDIILSHPMVRLYFWSFGECWVPFLCINNIHAFVQICRLYYIMRRCPWCNGYRRKKWTRWHEFKSWTRLIAFHIPLILLGKVWIQLFSLQLWVNSRTDCVLQPWWGN